MVKIFGSGSYGKLRAWVTSTLSTHTSIVDAHHSKYTDAEVDTIVAAHTAIAAAHHSKYTDAEVDTIVAAHTAIAAAHHSKYTDAEVDTIVAAHTAITAAHHSKYLDSEAVSAMGAKGDGNALNHDKYTDGEVDAILSVHTAIAAAHHSKYTDAEAVSAVATADDYVKNVSDTLNGQFTIKNTAAMYPFYIIQDSVTGAYLNITAYRNNTFGGGFVFSHARGTEASPLNLNANDYIWLILGKYYKDGGFVSVIPIQHKYLGGSATELEITVQLNLTNQILKDPKNHAATALSGTKKLVEIDIGGTPYYFEVYPTKA